MRGLALAMAGIVARPLGWMLAGTVLLLPLLFSGRSDLALPEQAATDSFAVTEPQDRVALVALFRAGLIRQAAVYRDLDEAEETPSGKERLEWATSAFTEDCTLTDRSRAILAAEGYARPAWRRDLEVALAGVVQSVSGTLPDYSLGLGQVRISTAQAALAQLDRAAMDRLGLSLSLPTDAAKVHRLLLDACGNQQMTEIVVMGLLPLDAPMEEVAAAYRGGRSWPVLPGVMTYESLVARIEGAVLPSARETLSIGRFSLSRHEPPPAAQLTDAEMGEAELLPLACIGAEYMEIYRPAVLAHADPEGFDPAIHAEALRRLVAALQPERLTVAILPPAEGDEALPLRPPLGVAAGAALVLARMDLLGLDRVAGRSVVTDPTEAERLRHDAPYCAGWLVLGENASEAWMRALRAL